MFRTRHDYLSRSVERLVDDTKFFAHCFDMGTPKKHPVPDHHL